MGKKKVKVKVKVSDLRKYFNFCDLGTIYNSDVWESRCALKDALVGKPEFESDDLVGWPAWTTQENDVIGGFIVTTYPYPASMHDHLLGGDPMKNGYIVADCMTDKDANEITEHLNRNRYVPILENPARWRWVTTGYLGHLRQSPYGSRNV